MAGNWRVLSLFERNVNLLVWFVTQCAPFMIVCVAISPFYTCVDFILMGIFSDKTLLCSFGLDQIIGRKICYKTAPLV